MLGGVDHAAAPPVAASPRAGRARRTRSSSPHADDGATRRLSRVRWVCRRSRSGFIGHATVLLEAAAVRVLTDPFLRARLGPLERHGPLPEPATLDDVDVVVISHGHPDHFDRASLAALRGRPDGRRAARPGRRGTRRRSRGDGRGDRGRRTPRVARGRGHGRAGPRTGSRPGRRGRSRVGYVLDARAAGLLRRRHRAVPGMRELAGGVDVALLPVWTWGPHLGPATSARARRPRRWPTSGPRSRSRSTGGRSTRGGCTACGAGR